MTKHFYIKFPLLILTLCLLSGSFFAQNLSAQVTIWEEDFSSYANGVTSGGNNGVTWTISGNNSDYWFEVRNRKLELRDNNRNVAEWLTSSIDISAYTNVSISLNAQESGKLESQGTDDEDYILFQYQIDGGSWQNFSNSPWYDDFPQNNVDRNATVNSLNGSSLQVRVRFRNGTGRQEYYRIDDVIVSGYPNVGNSPTANCKDITIQLDGSGNKSITADDINNGSSDVETADADLILSLDKTSFDCADVGIQTVTLTVEDGDGNKSTCTANVTVEDNVAPSLLNLNAEYHDGMSLSDLKYSESVDEAHTNWGGSSPNTGLLGNDQFSIRYSGNFVVPETGNYTFYTNSDDGVRLQIDGAYVINNWTNHAPTVNSGTVNLTKGQHSITLEFYENGGGAVIELEWASALAGVTRETFSKSSILNHTTVETTVKLDASGNATLAAADVDPGFLDNCSVTSRSLSKSDFTTADIGVNTVVLTVQDASGNSTNINVLVTVEDNNDPSTASIEVDVQSPENAYSTSELVQKVLVTGCLTASNIVYSGDENYGIGYFNAVDSDFPLASGIILSTGRVKNAEGPNNSGSESQNIAGIAGDVDVSVLTGDNENDAQVLEFDFVPAGDILEFRYIFASEEYPEYACSNYNDVFAFIISGPGITADTDLSGKNIALIPGTTNPVTINNVNDSYCGNSTYYVDESSGYATQFDGRTTVLTATANVQACQTYHIRLIIADVLDDQYNSAVFLEANSFKSNEVQIDNMIGGIEGDQDVMYEGCEGSFIRFLRSEGYDINEEIVFDINITGTANNETSGSQDYVYTDASGNVIGDGVFPSSIIIPAGQEYIDYHYKAIDEGEVEDDETIIFRVDRCPCDGSEYFEKTVTIINAPKVNAVASAAIQCDGIGNPTATITVQLIDGISTANYLYSFDGGATFGSDNVKNIASAFADGHDLVGQTFNIVVRDLFSCSNNTLNLTTTIPDIQPIEADAGGDRNMCTGNGIQLLGSGGIYYEWTCDTPGIVENYLSDPNVSNPWISDDIPAGSYVFTLLVQDQAGASAICSDQESMTLTVLPSPVVNSVFAGKYELCSSEQTSLQADVNMSVSYEWNPSSGLDNANNANPVFSANVVSEESRSYTLTVTAGNGCSTVANLENAITVYPNPSIALNAVLSNFCSDGSNGELHVDVTGGTPETSSPFYTYAWSHNASLNSAAATGLSDGSYTITVTDSKSCSDSETYEVSQQPSVPAGDASQSFCGSATVGELIASSSVEIDWYSASTGGSLLNSTDALLDGTTYYAEARNATTGCVSSSRFAVNVTISPQPTASAGGTQTTCPNMSVTVNGTSSSNGTIAWTHNGTGSLSNETTLTPTYTPTNSDLGNTVTLAMTVTGENSCSSETAVAYYSVVVEDNVDPTITAPADVNINSDAGSCDASSVTLGSATTNDNCGVASVTNNAPATFPLGSTTVTWTVTDNAGRTATDTQVVTVTDNEDPTITAPADVNINSDAGSCDASSVTLGSATTNDNCGVASVTNNAPATFPLGSTTVTWTVTDNAGRTATDTQVVTVTDNEDPTITAPADVNINSDAGSCDASSVTLGSATTNDNCGVASVTNNAPATFPLGATTVIWTVTDNSGRTATATQVVTVLKENNISVVDVTGAIDPSTDPGVLSGDHCPDLNGLQAVIEPSGNTYSPGTSQLQFRVDRLCDTGVWSFAYQINGANVNNLVLTSDSGTPTNTSGVISASAAASYVLFTVDVENVVGATVSIDFTISDGGTNSAIKDTITIQHNLKIIPQVVDFE